MLARRRAIAKEYFDCLPARLTARLAMVKADSIFFRFPLVIDADFETMRRECEARGFAVRKGVDELIHREYGLDDRSFPRACRLFETTLSLPVYPALQGEELDRVLKGAGQVWPR